MKSLIRVLVLLAAVLALSVGVLGNNATWGHIGYFDRVIARDRVEHPANWFTKHKETILYPPKGHENFNILTAIRVTDYGGPKNFGQATLLQGGPGHFNATIEVRSQTRRPLNMTIEYFGRASI
ncbi:uncharacterized LOC106089093 precursor [Stomoxys calcitrans]|uniref:Putative 11.4 kDa secreted salivary gland protein n=1 Tax=Stomoxys calcitrans TaxID=35570 RepID=A5WXS0_STOCA|nr:uncharacterized LOC106089093 precursor [Stomoxys calcitrans]AAY34548.1 putative 11.4 kDa secreted salivary gland protein [Stomoxys calcitrans]